MLFWPVWKKRNKELAQRKQETLAVLQQRLTENRQQQKSWKKNWPTTKKIGTVIEHLQEQYVALLQTEAEKSMNGQPLRSDPSTLQESSHRQEDLTKAQTNFEAAKEKKSDNWKVGAGTSDGQRPISRIPEAIGKSGAGQSCLPRGSSGHV